MKILNRYQCDICGSKYDDEADAIKCEARGDASSIKDGVEVVVGRDTEYGECYYSIGTLIDVVTSGHEIRSANVIFSNGHVQKVNAKYVKAWASIARMMRFVDVTEAPNSAFAPGLKVEQ